MTPTHTNKRGARYRYYVSHALQQRLGIDAGTVPRVPAPDVEGIVVKALRERSKADGHPELADDRDLIECLLDRVVMKQQAIEICLKRPREHSDARGHDNADRKAGSLKQTAITIPWPAMSGEAAKGVLHSPSRSPTISSEKRDALLSAIAKARLWTDDLVHARVGSLSEIASREGKVERHIRLLTALAFVSPRVISEIIEQSAPADLTVTGLAQPLGYSWAEQDRRLRARNNED